MRKLLLLLPAFLLVAGCASEWTGEVRFKVREIGEITSGPRVSLDVDGEKPKGLQGVISGGGANSGSGMDSLGRGRAPHLPGEADR